MKQKYFVMRNEYFKWLRNKTSSVEEDRSGHVKHGAPLRGTKVTFEGLVAEGFMDSGWGSGSVYLRRYATRKEAIDAIIMFCSQTEIIEINLQNIEITPYFGVQNWSMAIYK